MASNSSKTIRDFLSDSSSAHIRYGAAGAQAYKYTSTGPHSCAHCQSITFPVHEFTKITLEEYDVRQLYHEYAMPACSAALLDFSAALTAARAGCALYEWVLDVLVDNDSEGIPLPSPSREFKLGLRFSVMPHNNWRWQFCAPLIATITDHEGVVHSIHCPERLACRVAQDDPSATLVPFRPAEGNVFSQKSIDFAKDCLRTCLGHHGDCVPDVAYGGSSELVAKSLLEQPESEASPSWASASIPPDDLPTRLLEIGNGSAPLVRLVDLTKSSTGTVSNISSAGYAALSYCWGASGNPVQLLQTTNDTLERGILCTQLPGTLRDVVLLSALIGIKYIWIDALCIYQDSDADKQVELAKMAQYYHNNTVTICAASAASAAEGLQKQSARPVHKYGPIAIRIEDKGDKTGSQILLHSDALELSEPTTTRGWTMQESLLSRRLLICSDQLYFCCATSNAECEGIFTKLSKEHDRNFSDPKSLVPGIFPASVWRIYPLMFQWQSAAREFSKRAISFADDKLPAISGFARVIHAKCRATEDDEDAVAVGISDPALHRRYPVQYDGVRLMCMAGLFFSYDDQTVNSKNLLWESSRTGIIRYTGGYRAPSWSWACLDGPIVGFHGSGEGDRVVARLTHHEYEPVSDLNPYGAVRYASIHVSAPIRLARDITQVFEVRWGSELSSFGLSLYPDTEQDMAELKQKLELENDDTYLMCFYSHAKSYEGLIIWRAEASNRRSVQEEEGMGSFCRKGYFMLREPHVAKESGHQSYTSFGVGHSIIQLI